MTNQNIQHYIVILKYYSKLIMRKDELNINIKYIHIVNEP